jgi:hypothetical protein
MIENKPLQMMLLNLRVQIIYIIGYKQILKYWKNKRKNYILIKNF